MAKHLYFRKRWTDHRTIDLRDARERLYWSKFFGVDEIDLMIAVDKVGTEVEAVRQYLHREKIVDWIVDAGRNARQYDSPRPRTA